MPMTQQEATNARITVNQLRSAVDALDGHLAQSEQGQAVAALTYLICAAQTLALAGQLALLVTAEASD